jgi:hypothetical protein
MEQIVDFPTRLDNTLDLVFTTHRSLVNKCKPLPGISDHDIVLVDTNIRINMLWKLMLKMRKVSVLARVVSLVLCCFGDDDASGLLMVDMLLSKLDKLSILTLLSLNSTQ